MGIMFSIPIRRALILDIEPPLAFPEGVACANVLKYVLLAHTGLLYHYSSLGLAHTVIYYAMVMVVVCVCVCRAGEEMGNSALAVAKAAALGGFMKVRICAPSPLSLSLSPLLEGSVWSNQST